MAKIIGGCFEAYLQVTVGTRLTLTRFAKKTASFMRYKTKGGIGMFGTLIIAMALVGCMTFLI